MIEANYTIRRLMEQKGYSGTGLAKAVNVSDGYISLVVRKKRTLSPPLAKRICNTLGCDFKDIFDHVTPWEMKRRKQSID